MKCYNHPDKDAVATCYACHKGVCPECYALVSETSACRNSCEERVKDLVDMINRNVSVSKSYIEGKIADESLDVFYNQLKNVKYWIVIIGVISTLLLIKFVQSLSDKEPALQYLYILVFFIFALIGVFSSYSRYRRLIKNREKVLSIWESR